MLLVKEFIKTFNEVKCKDIYKKIRLCVQVKWNDRYERSYPIGAHINLRGYERDLMTYPDKVISFEKVIPENSYIEAITVILPEGYKVQKYIWFLEDYHWDNYNYDRSNITICTYNEGNKKHMKMSDMSEFTQETLVTTKIEIRPN